MKKYMGGPGKGPYTYYTITLGGVGGPGTNDDIDGALRGGWGV